MREYRVLIVQAMCKQYRAPLFARMYQELATDNIEMRVAYSRPPEDHRTRNDNVDLPSEYGIQVRHRTLLGGRLLLQLPLRAVLRADLVIVEHALKHLVNFPLLVLSFLKLKKLGFWLHGGTLRHASSPLLRPWRLRSMLAANWVFAYTRQVADAAVMLGAPPGRVTALQNAIDLSGFRNAMASVSSAELEIEREHLGIATEGHTALFCGSLYPGRGADFLVTAGDLIARRDPRFHLIVLGAGPLQAELQAAAGTRPWLHVMGSIFDDRRAVYFRLARLCLMPYLAGLGILDAMAAGLPYVVTGARATNPEIDYLVDGVTGLVTGDSVEQFAGAVTGLFADTERLRTMSEAAALASEAYSIENMSANFCAGIRACLAQPQREWRRSTTARAGQNIGAKSEI